MKNLHLIITTMLLVTLPSVSSSATYSETTDAGASIPTAQALSGGTTQILGYSTGDLDTFRFGWTGGLFSANTYGSGWDTRLSLWDALGALIAHNDDNPYPESALNNLNLGMGNYYIGISYWTNSLGSSNLSTSSTDPNPGSNTGTPYVINMSTTAPVSNVPEPTTIALIGLGFAGLGYARRKARQA